MNTFFDDKKLHMMRLGFESEETIAQYQANKIRYNKAINRINAKARENSKASHCYVCKKECSSFCKSHSVPQFILKRISEKGIVYSPFSGELPFWRDDIGVGNAGTFFLICRDCDSKIFSDYENPKVYSTVPSNKIMAQIAMKNYLHSISNRNFEIALYDELSRRFPDHKEFFDEKNRINKLDLLEYQQQYERASRAAKRTLDNTYYLVYFNTLDYVVPVAGQASIAVISDFEDKIINDVFVTEADNHVEEIHLSIFPLESTSVIIMFIDSKHRRYRNFYRQFRKLTPDDQLAAINYIFFSYSENIFITEEAGEIIKANPMFNDVCSKSVDAISPHPFTDPTPTAIEEFSLKKRGDIPNLLAAEYALKSNK